MPAGDGEGHDYVVDKSGRGDYESIQAAIDGAKAFPRERITIFVTDDVYNEKVRVPSWNPKISLIGESEANTVLTYDDHFETIERGPNSTFFTYTLKVCGNDFRARNLTVQNAAGPEREQAVALHVEANRAVFENCQFVGNQDTVYAAGEGARQYFRECYVEGTTDFVFGGATAVFERCDIHSKANSYVTAASTHPSEPFGYVFRECTLTTDPEVSDVYLGRPWRNYAHVAFIQSYLGSHVHPTGWHNWSRPEAEETVTFAEYDNRGPGARAGDERAPWSKELTSTEAETYATEPVLTGEHPQRSGEPWYRITTK
ncbi:pectinesterase family protein [Haloprofundus salilacus]|uniref:pectinesterase family protein n=1 Tax=Haloprofundus salilacus TaxID=2876190 RepID=UPI001CC9A3B8|nr:pectinesterase family protein [Haloprofundus salilacus]